MKMVSTLSAVLLLITSALPGRAATPVIGGALGNGNFNNGATLSGTLYSASPNWHWANGDDTSQRFLFTSLMNGSSDPGSGGGYVYQNRLVVNDTGYTVAAAGEIFSLSYEFGAGGSVNNYGNDEFLRAYLFTATAPVDASLTAGQMTPLSGNDDYYMNRSGGTQWTSHSQPNLYTSTAADIGKTVYLALIFNNPVAPAPAPNPRIENVLLEVTAGPTNPPPQTPLTGWQQFVDDYNLSGFYLTDQDGDGHQDIFEYAHGGNPTNPASKAATPFIGFETNGAVSFHCLETAHTNPGIPYAWEWADNLITGTWHTAWNGSNSAPSSVPGYNEVTRSLNTAADGLYFRNRVLAPPQRPNILLILADDLGYADVSFNVDTPAVPEITTPNLDRLAHNGMRFTSAYVAHPFCGPSRMGLFSGRYPHEFGGPFNLPILNSGAYTDQGISTNEVLLSTVLHNAGYRTGAIGKWHMGEQAPFHPNNRGFDEFYGFLGGGKNYFGPYQQQTGSVYDYKTYWESNGVDVVDPTVLSGYLTDTLTSQGERFIRDSAGSPFFLYMAYNAPHTPLQALQSDKAMFPNLTGDRQTYAGMVYAMDRGVGRLIQALEDTGQMDNTLIIFFSDNGGKTVAGADNGLLKGTKGDTTEGGFRVPMFMHWPLVIPPGVDYTHPVSALDFYPTLARLTAADIPAGKLLDGKDIWDDILADRVARAGESIYTVRYRIGNGASGVTDVGIRRDQWKALKWYGANWKLFNIENDIGETTDLSAAYPAVLSSMVQDAGTWAANEHIRPLWFDSTTAEADWDSRGMPHYDTTFTLP